MFMRNWLGRTMLRAGLPAAQIILRTETPLTKTEAIQALGRRCSRSNGHLPW